MTKAHNTLTYHSWILDEDCIFHHIDIFTGRCRNMIEICQAMIDFARLVYTTCRQ